MFYADLMLNKYVFVLVVVCLIFFAERKIYVFFLCFFLSMETSKEQHL